MGKMKLIRLLATGVAVSAALIYSMSTIGAQSVPVGSTAPTTSAPANPPGTPPQSPVEPPSNGGNVGGAGNGPAALPSAGTGDAGNGSNNAEVLVLAAGLALAGAGIVGRRFAGRGN